MIKIYNVTVAFCVAVTFLFKGSLINVVISEIPPQETHCLRSQLPSQVVVANLPLIKSGVYAVLTEFVPRVYSP